MATPIETLRAAHHPVRRRIVDYLAFHGPTQVGTLAKAFDQQVGSISHHLRILQRAGLVEQAPELATDGRTSWWRGVKAALTWSVDDYESAAERVEAKAAERLNIDHQIGKLAEWKSVMDRAPQEWRRAAFSTDRLTTATAAELADLAERIATLLNDWTHDIDRADGQDREPVFIFAHGFRTQP